MRTHVEPIAWDHGTWPGRERSLAGTWTDGGSASAPPVAWPAAEGRGEPMADVSRSVRLVGLLAFGQAILMIVLFLFLCARAGAAEDSKTSGKLDLVVSAYETATVRDPFGAEVAKGIDAGPVKTKSGASMDSIKLAGILYDARTPAALINDELVELNRPTKIQLPSGTVEVKAIQITREAVVLEVGGQKLELRLGGAESNNGGSK